MNTSLDAIAAQEIREFSSEKEKPEQKVCHQNSKSGNCFLRRFSKYLSLMRIWESKLKAECYIWQFRSSNK